jgi:hypothetical protein
MSLLELPTDWMEFVRAWPECWSRFATRPDGWPVEAWDEGLFRQQAFRLFELQFRYNAPYRRWCEARGVHPDRVRDWREIPAVPTAAFAEFEFTCLPPGMRPAVFHSSGTTRGRPGRHYHNAETLAVYETALWWGFERALWTDRVGPEAMALLILMPPPTQAPHSSLVYMCETVRRRMGQPPEAFAGRVDSNGAWDLDPAHVWSRLRHWSAQGRPVMILATAFMLVRLLDAPGLDPVRLALPPGSRLMETGGYKGRTRELSPAELRRLLEERLGLPAAAVISEYGMCELGSQAYDGAWPREGLGVTVSGGADRGQGGSGPARIRRRFRFPPWVRIQVLDPETGAEVPEGGLGLLQVTDLANVGSVLAIRTEDLVEKVRDGFRFHGRAAGAEPKGCSLWTADRAVPGTGTLQEP